MGQNVAAITHEEVNLCRERPHELDCEKCAGDSEFIHASADEVFQLADDALGLLRMAGRPASVEDRRTLLSAAAGLLGAVTEKARLIGDHSGRPDERDCPSSGAE